MLFLKEHLDKNNLHHAYLIEGNTEKIIPEILIFLESLKIKTSGNPDLVSIFTESFKIEDARNLKSMSSQRQISSGKKIFLISSNSFQLEAQNALLKILEEPIQNTHFFVITPDTNILIKTFISRFYLIKRDKELKIKPEVKDFVSMSARDRIDFLKEFLKESEEDDIGTESARSRSLNFLNSLESVLHQEIFKTKSKGTGDIDFFNQIFKVREYLRQPGSSTKSLMESIALSVPEKIQ